MDQNCVMNFMEVFVCAHVWSNLIVINVHVNRYCDVLRMLF